MSSTGSIKSLEGNRMGGPEDKSKLFGAKGSEKPSLKDRRKNIGRKMLDSHVCNKLSKCLG